MMKFEPAGLVKRRAQIKTSGGGDYNVRIKKWNHKNSTIKCSEGGKTTWIDVDKIVSIKPRSLVMEILGVVLLIGLLLGSFVYVSNYTGNYKSYVEKKWEMLELWNKPRYKSNRRYDE